MKILRKKLFFLSSADRQITESNNQFSIAFPDNLLHVAPNELLRITMTYFSLTNSFQNINSNNNRIGVSLVQSSSTHSGFITLPVGSYSLYVLASNMTSALNALFGAYTTFSVSIFSTNTYQSLWSWTTAITSLNMYFVNSSLPTNLFNQQQISFPMNNGAARLFGFAHTTTSITLTTSGYISPLNMYAGMIPYLRLHVDVPPQNIEYDSSMTNNMLNYSDVLAQVPILAPPYAPIIFQEFAGDNNTFEFPFKGMRIGTMNFYLTDNYNTLAILNDDFDFCLKIEVCVDEQGDTKDILQETLHTLKLQTLNMDKYFSG